MNDFLKILSLFCIIAFVAVCGHASTTMPFKITGELITIEPEVNEEDTAQGEEGTNDSASHVEAPPIEPADLSNATLTVSYETTNAEGEAETITLYEGPYQEKFENVMQVSEPTEATIALKLTEESDPMSINTVIGTDSDVRFAYLDRPGPNDDFLLVGSANQVMNPENKFSISGDLSFLDDNETNTTTVDLIALVYDDEGQRQWKEWGPVLVNDGSFSIEGDIDQSIMARLQVSGTDYFIMSEVILEPQGNFVVSQLGNQTQELRVASGFGYHAMLIESWQHNKDYISLVEAYATEYEQYVERWRAGEPEPEVDEEGDSDIAENEADTEDSSDSEDSIAEATAAEGCEEAVAQESEIAESSYTPPKYYSLMQKKDEFRNQVLREIAEGDGDPMARYLAIDMNPYDWRDYTSQLAVLRPLAKEFDEDFVASHIQPTIERMERGQIIVQNDEALVPGQKVPEFSLVDYDGDDKSLYDLLGDNDLVLIDFWASWCGPCIADFPELKKLHTAYTDENFEIVGVSIDSTMEDWKGGVDEHELPWINLGEVKGWEGPVSTMYGVNAIPKGFLVDSQGCIYKKNIRPAALKDFLVDRYGMDESLVEPEEETEDTPEVSS